MEIGKQIKEHRKRMEWTQKGLAAKLNVSDKTISSWETGRTYPELSLLVELSELFNTSLDELLKGDEEVVKRIDKDVKLKKVYKYGLIATLLIVFSGIIFLTHYQNQNQWVDRFNPFMEMKIGYATLPTSVTYNDGKKYKEDGKKEQYPDRSSSGPRTPPAPHSAGSGPGAPGPGRNPAAAPKSPEGPSPYAPLPGPFGAPLLWSRWRGN